MRDSLRVQVVVAEGLDDELADDGSVLLKEGVAKPVRGAGDQVGEEVAEDAGREDQPGRGAGGKGDDDADEERNAERARYGDPDGLEGRESGRLTGYRSGCLRRLVGLRGRQRLSFNNTCRTADRTEIVSRHCKKDLLYVAKPIRTNFVPAPSDAAAARSRRRGEGARMP